MPQQKEIDNRIKLNPQYEVQEILGNPSSWMLRWGVSLIGIFVLIFLLLSWIIRYPDVVEARVSLVTENPAITVVARTSGKIEHLLVQEQSPVEKGQIMAVLESPARYQDVLRLERLLHELDTVRIGAEIGDISRFEGSFALGEFQPAFASFLQLLEDYQYFLGSQGYQQKVQAIHAQIQHYTSLNSSLKKQLATLRQEVDIAKKDLERNRSLKESGAISALALEQVNLKFLQYRRQLENLESQIIMNQIQADQLRAQRVDINQLQSDGNSAKVLALQEARQVLTSQIQSWKQQFLIEAPIEGIVTMTQAWSEKKYVNLNDPVFSVVPNTNQGKIIGTTTLPVLNSGKVALGMRANIRLDGYPYQEFGVIKGVVNKISLVPQKENYLLELSIPDTLQTTFGVEIPFKQEMLGSAFIITEDRRIIDRIFNRLFSLIKNN